MTDVTLALPFSLPPPELAPDLARHLKTPALAALLSKTASTHLEQDDAGIRHLPHERWLARQLGAGAPAFASLAMRGFGLDPAGGGWFMVHPAHIEIARSHLLLNDLRQLALSDAHSRSLFDAVLPLLGESGVDMLYGEAGTWFMRCAAWEGIDTASPDAAAGLDISFFLPTGARSAALRRLQNEIQMLWHDHPANREREGQRLVPVNAIWTWSADGAHAGPASRLFTCGATGWMDALARASGGRMLDVEDIAAAAGGILWCGQLEAPAIAQDWSGWVVAMQELETRCFAPLLAAVRSGAVRRARIVLTGRDKLLETGTTALAQRKFWRPANLGALLA